LEINTLLLLHLVGFLYYFTYVDDARSNTNQVLFEIVIEREKYCTEAKWEGNIKGNNRNWVGLRQLMTGSECSTTQEVCLSANGLVMSGMAQSVDIRTRLEPGRSKNRDLVSGRGKEFFFCYPEREVDHISSAAEVNVLIYIATRHTS
jgi:hypothetical protein